MTLLNTKCTILYLFHRHFWANPLERKSLIIYSCFARPQYSYSCGRESPLWDVKREALSCGDRPITQQLARHKEPHPHFTPEKPVQTQIPPSALKSSASERLLYLSTPKERPEGPFRSPAWEVSRKWSLTPV